MRVRTVRAVQVTLPRSAATTSSAVWPGLDHSTVITDHSASEILGSPFIRPSHAITSVIISENMGLGIAGQAETVEISHLLTPRLLPGQPDDRPDASLEKRRTWSRHPHEARRTPHA